MSITPRCDRCGSELTEFGGLLFSPPMPNPMGTLVQEYHFCTDRCWPWLRDLIHAGNGPVLAASEIANLRQLARVLVKLVQIDERTATVFVADDDGEPRTPETAVPLHLMDLLHEIAVDV